MNLKIKTLLLSLFVFTTAAFAQSNCRDLRGCDRKLCELNIKLEYAKKYGRTGQIQRIERAIANTERNCNANNGHYTADLEKKVLDKEYKVKERTMELEKAIREQQRPEKIEKRRRKVAEAKQELAEAKRRLAEVKKAK